MPKTDRRRFLHVAGTAAVTGVIAELRGSAHEHADDELLVTGTSGSGNLQEALEAAIAEAFGQGPQHPDVLLDFEVKSINGRIGGFAGFNQVMVTICARFN